MLLKDLLEILKGKDPERELGTEFFRMLPLVDGMFRDVNSAVWGGTVSEDLCESVRKRDIEINQLERASRKRVLNHLALGDASGIPYCYILINVVKDAERIGDYIKNLVEPPITQGGPLPQGEIRDVLKSSGEEISEYLGKLEGVFREADRGRAEDMVRSGRALSKKLDGLIEKIAAQEYSSKVAVALALMSRYYKRINAHAVNIASSVIMPLHKIDYFDEDELGRVSLSPES